jgi:20S proteasome alpha/beta subunit
MNNSESESIIALTKQQASLYLLDAEEFYPFGTYMDMTGQIKPIGVYLEEGDLSIPLLISMLEKHIKQRIDDKALKIGVIAINVAITENGNSQDAIEMTVYKPNMEVEKQYFKYRIKDKRVDFF